MSTPKETLWSLEDHTVGKHLVLKEYLKAWYPIMGRYNHRILLIDGFAGPGEYAGGEQGSPIVALRTLIDHERMQHIEAEFVFMFIEQRKDRLAHLEGLIDGLRPDLPPGCTVKPILGNFDAELSNVFDHLDEQKKKVAPAFVMIDPFGVSDTPMELLGRILKNEKCEVYASFMYEAINRFKSTPEFERQLNSLFGCPEWKEGVDEEDPIKRKDFFYGLYETQLKKAGANQVVRFELYEGNRLVYAIFFATSNSVGSDRMKQAIWKVAPFGDFKFHGTRSPQLTLFGGESDTEPLQRQLSEKFVGKGYVPIEAIEEFVRSDETDYHSGHLKKRALVPMENARKIEVDGMTRKKRNIYPPGCKIRFV